eukprot:CCRYP_009753-RA/>CCRYP_009753-RA protein AED:0.38 eAED:0.38 QI:0/-1/0/1/-1/1/1/0/65
MTTESNQKPIVISETRDVCKASHGRHNSGWKMNGGVKDEMGWGVEENDLIQRKHGADRARVNMQL